VLLSPLSWTEEAARYLYVYVVFLGSSIAVTDRTHVSIDVLVNRLPPPLRLAVIVLVHLAVLFLLGNLFYWGIRATVRQLNIPLVVLDIPYAWVYVIVPVTAALMTVRTLFVLGQDVRRYREGRLIEADPRAAL
jgi:TRAP-type transport system small permease protein